MNRIVRMLEEMKTKMSEVKASNQTESHSAISGVRASVDLSKCSEGDILISKHGLELTYLRPEQKGSYYDHRVRYEDGSEGTRTNDGYVFKRNRLPGDHDIVEVKHWL